MKISNGSSHNPRRARYARLTVLLTVAVLIAVILGNVLISSLANRFGWYLNMGRTTDYKLSEQCREVLAGAISDADRTRSEKGEAPLAVTILFCQTQDAVAADTYLGPIYRMAMEIRDAFPGTVTVDCRDIFRNPSAVAKYRGEEKNVSIPDYSVIIDAGERWSVLSRENFYELSSEDYSTTMGFSGNSRFAVTISTLASGKVKYACLTSSHGETFADREVQHILTDAGYLVTTIDLRTEEIPAECSLLITYSPETDLLTSADVSDVSETDKIEAFLGRGGNYMVYLGTASKLLPNLDALLEKWGIRGDTFTVTATDGSKETYRYTVRNESSSTTAGGYTISAARPSTEAGDRIFRTLGDARVSFGNVTSFSPADGWEKTENGFSWTSGSRTATALFVSSSGSEAYAAGRLVESGRDFPLAVYTSDASTGGGVTVLGTPEILTGTVLQSPVLGNRQALLCLFNEYDGGVVLGINYATWPSSRMETATTRETRNLTILLVAFPAVCVTVAGCVVLLRRRRISG